MTTALKKDKIAHFGRLASFGGQTKGGLPGIMKVSPGDAPGPENSSSSVHSSIYGHYSEYYAICIS